ncbi:siderophore esteras-like protein IroE-like protein [Zopfia rhizophila CBS 207.26]|uniref:Siderophore esteras-like protein IroE-like protein n=1 Tax=Zopfia rhizophila CBS 207.26 TaxID=1314779 RepID=A0A6A6DXC9_9PEZI|nr:siderophore esteras-like protein IroE-like protein [Zopfia rhizophila CBS 207.26]
MTNGSSIGTWSFHPLITSFPPTVLPNIAYWNVTNGTWEYQVQLSWPLNWISTNVNSTVDTLYVLDGNALAQTATEAFRKRRPVDSTQPDTIVVSIGYPNLIPNSPYSEGRYYDYQMPVCGNCTPPDLPGVPPNADNFITFLDNVLRPWVRNTVFPNVEFNRDGLYGHSFSGLFVLYTLLVRPDLFDVFLSASPALYWNNDYIFSQLGPFKSGSLPNRTTKPAFQISYGGYEQFPQKRRRETEEEYEARRVFLSSMRMTDLCNQLYDELKDSPRLRHIELHEYPFSYHAAVGSEALCDGIDYFLDW